jgi:protein SCO1/2
MTFPLIRPSRSPCRRTLLAGLLATLLASGAAEPAGSAPAASTSLFAGHFLLRDTSGAAVDSDALSGRPYGVFFGFTHCPDICPTTLARISLALRGIADPDLRIYFVTVDPERDTAAALGPYMESFDPRIVALTGDRAAIDEAVASFGAVAERTALAGGGYTYGHTAALLIVDENGLIADRIAAEGEEAALTARLSRLARPRPKAGP